jgi:predicted  nucleic acid-binding Zn-ribbon protein
MLLVMSVILICWFGFIDQYAEEYINSSIATSLVSFGIAKGFNATVSVLSTITLQAPFVGSIQIGELLDPLNDLVEDFSTIMKYSISSLLIQKLIVEILQTIHFKIFLTLSGLAFIATKYTCQKHRELSYKVFIFALACKFSIALVAIASSFVDSAFLNETIEKENNTLNSFPISSTQLNQSLDLTNEIKQQIKLDMDQREEHIRSLLIEIDELKKDKLEMESDLFEIERRIKAQSAEASMFNNLVNPSRELKHLQQKRNLLRHELYVVEGDIEDLQNDIESNRKDYSSLEKQYENDDTSTFQNLRNGFNHLAFAAKNKIVGFVDSLNLAMDNFLNLMALFIFKTMVIPIVFLWGMYKVFKAIWNMTPTAAIRKM